MGSYFCDLGAKADVTGRPACNGQPVGCPAHARLPVPTTNSVSRTFRLFQCAPASFLLAGTAAGARRAAGLSSDFQLVTDRRLQPGDFKYGACGRAASKMRL